MVIFSKIFVSQIKFSFVFIENSLLKPNNIIGGTSLLKSTTTGNSINPQTPNCNSNQNQNQNNNNNNNRGSRTIDTEITDEERRLLIKEGM
ncbi:hypothetical protein BLA29_008414 [Euroglyphus maynei]|uniref:Uncharacterized protein n=1 Tax=Euroglyphus maynei TaxID=6958 RepID=A0A1Y3BUS9_EURMA|nr:hypothetical protein BLA29_008414 [Euroglyphus maynei]